MQNQESKNFENPITNKVYYYLASILYSKCSIPWNELKPISLFLYQNHKFGPKGTRELSARLYRIYSLLYEKNLTYPSALHDEKGECITYGEMQANKNTNAFKNIEELTNQMIKDFKNEDAVNKYIFYLKERMEKNVSYLVRKKEMDSTIEETIQKEMLELMDKKRTAPEDIFHQVKRMRILLTKNAELKEETTKYKSLPHEEARKMIESLCNDRVVKQPINNKSIPEDPIKEIIENFFNDDSREDVLTKENAILKRLEILWDNTPEDDINKMILKIEIDDFQNVLHSGNMETIQSEMKRLEEVLDEQEQEIMIRS